MAKTLRLPNTSPRFTGCEQSVVKVTLSSSVPMESKSFAAVMLESVVLPGTLAALTSTTCPRSTPAGLPVSSQTMLPVPSVTRIRTGSAVGLFTNWVHVTLPEPCESAVAAQPPPAYCSRSTLILPRQFGGGGGAGRPVSHAPDAAPHVSVPSVGSFKPTRVQSG